MHGELAKRRVELDWERYIAAMECAYGVDPDDDTIGESDERILWRSERYERAYERIARNRDAREQAERWVDELRDNGE